MGAWVDTGAMMMDPLVSAWQGFLAALPGIFWAIVLIIIGWAIAKILGKVLEKLLVKIKLDSHLKKAGVTDKIGHIEISHLAGEILKWYVLLVFLGEAVTLLKLSTIKVLLGSFLFWLPNVLIALIIIILGLLFADFVAAKMDKSNIKSVRFVSMLVKVGIMFFAVVMAFKQLGLYVDIAETTFVVLLAGVSLALALAVGIGFGLALKDEAKDIIKVLKKKL